MSFINFDLQASHSIISILEKSKLYSEDLISGLPDFFVLVQKDGSVLKGNPAAAAFFGIDSELLLGSELKSLFKPESWNIFLSKIEFTLNNEKRTVDFELSMGLNPESERIFYWSLSNVRKAKANSPSIITVIGRDITDLRHHEKKLMEMFACMPIGIITLAQGAAIESPYSAYTEFLLGQKDLVGKNIFSVFFSHAVALSELEKEGLQNLLKFYQLQFSTYELIEETFPKKLKFKIEVNGKDVIKHFGLTYQPIVYQNEVRRLMVLIEDRTAIVQLEDENARRKLLEDSHIQRIMQLKTCDQEILPDVLGEIQQLVGLCRNLIKGSQLQELAHKLHGVKGNARIGDFKFLMDKAHSLEKDLLSGDLVETNELNRQFGEIEKEWNELIRMYNALFAKEMNITINKQDPLSIMRKRMEKQVEITAYKLGKKVVVEVIGSLDNLSPHLISSLNEVCLHLINNSIDHGIPEGKTGTVTVYLEPRENGVFVTVTDDGKGIQVEEIRHSAIKKQIIQADQILTSEQITELIFTPQFSTSKQITEISGRGIGLNAVKNIIEERQGWIKVGNSPRGQGTEFSFFLSENNSIGIRRVS